MLFWLLTSVFSHSFEFSTATKEAFFERSGNEKALKHLGCILDMTRHRKFRTKESTVLQYRCEEVENGGREVSVNNTDWAVIVDYTLSSATRRFFLFDLKGDRKIPVVSFYVGHGRFGNTSHTNTHPGPSRNTVSEISYYSNVPGSNATSSGFYITGHNYLGPINGPSGKELSLVLHGLEKGVNENACDRAVVMHGASAIRESGSRQGVRRMSSGCFIVDYNWVTELTRRLKGSRDGEKRLGGVPFFVYGSREAALPEDYYCSESASETVMFD